MSNLTKGKKVRIKATGEIGVIKDFERIKRQSGKMEDVTYLVKLSDKAGWVQCQRNNLQLLVDVSENKERVYPKTYVYEETIPENGRTITVVGVVDVASIPHYLPYEKRVTEKAYKCKTLSVAYAICHPEDEYDHDYAVKLATKRCDWRPMAEYTSPQTGEFRPDIVDAILKVKCEYIKNNIDKFTNR